jgi:Mn2+/Fe2+ NRAMP family transporter
MSIQHVSPKAYPPADRSDAEILREAEAAGGWTKYRTYLALSGPGYLQSAITLGGGTLAGSLYLGVLAGTSMLWVQPLAMLLGIIMLSAIAYVTLSTGRRPFEAINTEVNPVFGWGWALAAFVANMVWVMPQYALAVGVFQQNLLPGVFGEAGPLSPFASTFLLAWALFGTALVVTWNYGRPGRGVKLFELLVKLMVAFIVLAFVGVAVRLALEPGALNWGDIARGFIPNPAMLVQPAAGFEALLAHVPGPFADYWREVIVTDQRGVIVATAATAVGINMTFIFGYSLLRRGWGREFRGFVRFDLGTGMLIPFLITTSCVVIAASSQFHRTAQPGLMDAGEAAIVEQQLGGEPRRALPDVQASAVQRRDYQRLLTGRALLDADEGTRQALAAMAADGSRADEYAQRVDGLIASLTPYDRYLAASLVRRNNFDLANALEPLLGRIFAQVVFGLGALGMTLSSIILLMVIAGIGFCEFLGKPHQGVWFRIGSLFPITGVLAPFYWAGQPWLVVPTSVFAFLLIPLAYISFFALMNQKTLLGADMPTGRGRIAWNVAMGVALLIIVPSSIYMLFQNYGYTGLAAVGVFLVLAGAVHLQRARRRA